MNDEELWQDTFELLDEYGEDTTDKMMDILRRNNKWASGKLLNSIDYDIEVQGQRIELVFEYAGHGQFVIDGRRPGRFPNITAIRNWILDKRIRNNSMSLESQTFLIARSIAERGIPALNFVKPVEDMTDSTFYNRLASAIASDIERQLQPKNN
jgi:hypothetical protein